MKMTTKKNDLNALIESGTVLTEKTIGGLKIRSVTEVTEYINMLVYGDPGIGKTRLAGSASLVPELSPVLVIDVEGGTMSLADSYPNVDVVRITSWASLLDVVEALEQDPTLYRTVVLDSLTEIQKFSMVQIMKATVAKDAKREVEVPSMREWGINGEHIRTLVRAFRDMGINVIATAHVLDDKDDRGGLTKTKPSLTGKLKNEVTGFMDIVLYMYNKRLKAEDNSRYIATLLLSKGTPEQVAKDRSGKLPDVMEAPDMAEIYAYFSGAKNKSDESDGENEPGEE